jgi:hypothetical protein
MTNILLQALQWIVDNPSAHPANMVAVARDAIVHHCDEVIAKAEGRELTASPQWVVAIYLVDRLYGGPEEGGWWYEAGVRLDASNLHIPVSPFPNRQWQEVFTGPLAEAIAEPSITALQAHLDKTANVGRKPISSVLSTGRFQAMMFEGAAPLIYPEKKPHYE